jgi:hypothetical protein
MPIMPGLTKDDHNTINRQHWMAIAQYLDGFNWQHVVVLTVGNRPGSQAPIFSANDLHAKAYPRFREIIKEVVGPSLQDFWVVERGNQTRRHHINLMLTADTPITEQLIVRAWQQVASSDVWQRDYDVEKGPYYWMKDIIDSTADVIAYGGSVVTGRGPAPKPVRTRKSDHNRARRRVRYRAQGVRYGS